MTSSSPRSMAYKLPAALEAVRLILALLLLLPAALEAVRLVL